MTAHCVKADIEEFYPGITTGIEDSVLTGLINNASEVIDFYTLSYPEDGDDIIKKAATVHQVAAYIETGNLQAFGLKPGLQLKVGVENLTVAEYICTSALRVLAVGGLTRPYQYGA